LHNTPQWYGDHKASFLYANLYRKESIEQICLLRKQLVPQCQAPVDDLASREKNTNSKGIKKDE